MELTENQKERIEKVKRFYPNKVDKVLTAIKTGKTTKENFWDQARIITKNITSDKGLSEWLMVFESIDDALTMEQ